MNQEPATSNIVGKREQPCRHILQQRGAQSLTTLVSDVDPQPHQEGNRLRVVASALSEALGRAIKSDLGHSSSVVWTTLGLPRSETTRSRVVPGSWTARNATSAIPSARTFTE